MRIPRSLILGPGSAFHLWWRGHNREAVLGSATEKTRYLELLARAQKSLSGPAASAVQIFSFCLMSNHAHLAGLLAAHATSLGPLSRLFQIAHSTFGRWYNRWKSRSGKVAEERFKTRLVQNDDALQTVMFYGDANPVKAGIVKHPKDYPWSSYQFYAFGRNVRGAELLTTPGWYRELANSPRERQRRYRQLVDHYLRNQGLLRDRPDETPEGYFVGTLRFVLERRTALLAKLRRLRRATAPAASP